MNLHRGRSRSNIVFIKKTVMGNDWITFSAITHSSKRTKNSRIASRLFIFFMFILLVLWHVGTHERTSVYCIVWWSQNPLSCKVKTIKIVDFFSFNWNSYIVCYEEYLVLVVRVLTLLRIMLSGLMLVCPQMVIWVFTLLLYLFTAGLSMVYL